MSDEDFYVVFVRHDCAWLPIHHLMTQEYRSPPFRHYLLQMLDPFSFVRFLPVEKHWPETTLLCACKKDLGEGCILIHQTNVRWNGSSVDIQCGELYLLCEIFNSPYWAFCLHHFRPAIWLRIYLLKGSRFSGFLCKCSAITLQVNIFICCSIAPVLVLEIVCYDSTSYWWLKMTACVRGVAFSCTNVSFRPLNCDLLYASAIVRS